jgi:quinolinate synthase
MAQVLYDYTRQDARGASCTAQAWAKVPVPLSVAERFRGQQPADTKARLRALAGPRAGEAIGHLLAEGEAAEIFQIL